ncbi:MAG: ChbG/HpnK family deacetylase [Chlorobia bacterium]|nr:ChbG/HpnK family deacetylase [Fimbriimonadaceae bacterium]
MRFRLSIPRQGGLEIVPRIIFRADDAGCAESANLGILDCLEAGVVKNVGIMAPGPAFEHAASLFRGIKNVDFGLHITLNAEWEQVKWGPVATKNEVPTLLDGDFFTSFPKTLHDRGFSVEEAIYEIRAQLERVRNAGLDVAYVDQHMGVGWINGLGEAISRLIEEEGVCDGAEVPSLEQGPNILARIQRADGTRMFVAHPSRDGVDVRQFQHEGLEPGQVAEERDAERRMLIAPEFAGAMKLGKFESVRFSEVAGEEMN